MRSWCGVTSREERHQRVVSLHRDGASYVAIASSVGLSRSRVAQIIAKARACGWLESRAARDARIAAKRAEAARARANATQEARRERVQARAAIREQLESNIVTLLSAAPRSLLGLVAAVKRGAHTVAACVESLRARGIVERRGTRTRGLLHLVAK